MSIFLGIDPGSRKTGYGLIKISQQKLMFIDCGVIALGGGALAIRLEKIFEEIKRIAALYKPDEAAIEQVFMHKNAQSALTLGHARGAAMVALTSQGLDVYEYSAREVKQAVVGFGGASKEQVQLMIRHLLLLSSIPETDAADALAIAICHAHTKQSKLALARAQNTEGLR